MNNLGRPARRAGLLGLLLGSLAIAAADAPAADCIDYGESLPDSTQTKYVEWIARGGGKSGHPVQVGHEFRGDLPGTDPARPAHRRQDQ